MPEFDAASARRIARAVQRIERTSRNPGGRRARWFRPPSDPAVRRPVMFHGATLLEKTTGSWVTKVTGVYDCGVFWAYPGLSGDTDASIAAVEAAGLANLRDDAYAAGYTAGSIRILQDGLYDLDWALWFVRTNNKSATAWDADYPWNDSGQTDDYTCTTTHQHGYDRFDGDLNDYAISARAQWQHRTEAGGALVQRSGTYDDSFAQFSQMDPVNPENSKPLRGRILWNLLENWELSLQVRVSPATLARYGRGIDLGGAYGANRLIIERIGPVSTYTFDADAGGNPVASEA